MTAKIKYYTIGFILRFKSNPQAYYSNQPLGTKLCKERARFFPTFEDAWKERAKFDNPHHWSIIRLKSRYERN